MISKSTKTSICAESDQKGGTGSTWSKQVTLQDSKLERKNVGLSVWYCDIEFSELSDALYSSEIPRLSHYVLLRDKN